VLHEVAEGVDRVQQASAFVQFHYIYPKSSYNWDFMDRLVFLLLKDLIGDEAISSQLVLSKVGHSVETHSSVNLVGLIQREYEKELLIRERQKLIRVKIQLEHEKMMREREQAAQKALLEERRRLEEEKQRIEARIDQERLSNQALLD
jgi:hypothetical protein